MNNQQLLILKLFDWGETPMSRLQSVITNETELKKSLEKLRNKGLIISSEGLPYWNQKTKFNLSTLTIKRIKG